MTRISTTYPPLIIRWCRYSLSPISGSICSKSSPQLSPKHFLSALEVVIADDGSGPEIQAKIRTLPADVFALSPENQGLGPNNNNGIAHCKGKYILMIQDDWECFGPPDYLSNAVWVLEANPQSELSISAERRIRLIPR